MGPTGRFLQPLGNMSFDDIYDTYKEQAEALIEGGVDFIIIETIIDVQEMRAALLASLDARECSRVRLKKMYKLSVNFLSVKMDVLLQARHLQVASYHRRGHRGRYHRYQLFSWT